MCLCLNVNKLDVSDKQETSRELKMKLLMIVYNKNYTKKALVINGTTCASQSKDWMINSR